MARGGPGSGPGPEGGRASARAGGRRPGLARRLATFLGVFLLLWILLNLLVAWAGAAPTLERPLTWPAVLAALVAALAASAWTMERVEGLPTAALGLPLAPGSARFLTLGFVAGAGIMALAVAILVAGGWLRWRTAPAGLGAGLLDGLAITALLLPAALAEELLFRGYPLQALAERFGGRVAVGATALGFAALHAANPGVDGFALLNLALAGLVLGVAWWRTYSLWFATGVHLGWNWIMGVAVDLPVSGLALDLAGFDAVLRGPELWTGGDFGPEGGLAVTIAAVLGLVWLARSPRLRRDVVALALGPLPERTRRREATGGR